MPGRAGSVVRAGARTRSVVRRMHSAQRAASAAAFGRSRSLLERTPAPSQLGHGRRSMEGAAPPHWRSLELGAWGGRRAGATPRASGAGGVAASSVAEEDLRIIVVEDAAAGGAKRERTLAEWPATGAPARNRRPCCVKEKGLAAYWHASRVLSRRASLVDASRGASTPAPQTSDRR